MVIDWKCKTKLWIETDLQTFRICKNNEQMRLLNRDELVGIIIDNSVLFQTKKGRKEQNLINQLEKLSRNLCYRIHNKRIMKLSEE